MNNNEFDDQTALETARTIAAREGYSEEECSNCRGGGVALSKESLGRSGGEPIGDAGSCNGCDGLGVIWRLRNQMAAPSAHKLIARFGRGD